MVHSNRNKGAREKETERERQRERITINNQSPDKLEHLASIGIDFPIEA